MQSSGLHIGGSWRHIQLLGNLGEIAYKGRLENTCRRNVVEGGTCGGVGVGASADKTEGRKSELMSDVLLADSFE